MHGIKVLPGQHLRCDLSRREAQGRALELYQTKEKEEEMIVNATLTAYEGGTDSHVVKMTFEIKKEDLAGLDFSRPEFVLEITPTEKLYQP